MPNPEINNIPLYSTGAITPGAPHNGNQAVNLDLNFCDAPADAENNPTATPTQTTVRPPFCIYHAPQNREASNVHSLREAINHGNTLSSIFSTLGVSTTEADLRSYLHSPDTALRGEIINSYRSIFASP